MSKKVKLYGHVTCPNVAPIRGMLARAKVEHEYINIHKDGEAAALVRDINDGYESVPTLVFPDGSTLTEPSVNQLKYKLESLGYTVGPLAWLIGNIWLVLIILAIIIALFRVIDIF
jgi:mycoredoxin